MSDDDIKTRREHEKKQLEYDINEDNTGRPVRSGTPPVETNSRGDVDWKQRYVVMSVRLQKAETEAMRAKENATRYAKALQMELGGDVDINKVLESIKDTGGKKKWQGRQQQILSLQAQLEEMNRRLGEQEGNELNDKQGNLIKQMNKQRMEEYDRASNEVIAKEEENKRLKDQMKGLKARSSELESTIKKLKDMIGKLLQKSDKDDKLIDDISVRVKAAEDDRTDVVKSEVKRHEVIVAYNKQLASEVAELRASISAVRNDLKSTLAIARSFATLPQATQESHMKLLMQELERREGALEGDKSKSRPTTTNGSNTRPGTGMGTDRTTSPIKSRPNTATPRPPSPRDGSGAASPKTRSLISRNGLGSFDVGKVSTEDGRVLLATHGAIMNATRNTTKAYQGVHQGEGEDGRVYDFLVSAVILPLGLAASKLRSSSKQRKRTKNGITVTLSNGTKTNLGNLHLPNGSFGNSNNLSGTSSSMSARENGGSRVRSSRSGHRAASRTSRGPSRAMSSARNRSRPGSRVM